MASLPTQRTLAALRAVGYTCAIVEHFNVYTKTRHDLFGFLDILAIRGGEPVLGIQCTSTSNAPSRQHKIDGEPRSAVWLATGSRVQVWGWAKRGPRGKRKVWTSRIVELSSQGWEETALAAQGTQEAPGSTLGKKVVEVGLPPESPVRGLLGG